MDNHAEKLTRQVEAECADEVTMATALRDWERAALRRLARDGRADDDLTAARRYTLTDEGSAWLEKQES